MVMQVLIVGGGKVGSYLASLLLEEHYHVRLIELREEELQRLRRELPAETVIHGNGTEPDTLEAAGIATADVMAAVTGSDEVNLVITNLARFEYDVPRTIARVNNPKNAWMFTPAMGVDVALNQADLMGRLIAEEMSLGDMMTLLKLRKGQFSLIEERIAPESPAAGKPVSELRLPEQCSLVAVIRKGELLIPRGDLVLRPADEVLALVHASSLDAFARQL